MITVTADTIYIDDGYFTFEDVFLSISNSKYSDQANKIGDNSYYFNFSFHIGKNAPAILKDKEKNIEIRGSLFQVHQDSTFAFGEQKNGESYIGGSFTINNPTLAYGFGSNIKTEDGFSQSGNLQLYCSYIDIPCFWGFFNTPDKQLVEIKDCVIKGFGRISGTDSYIENVICLSPETKYGSFATKGIIKYIKDLKIVNASDEAYAVYYNPKLSGNTSMSEVSIKNCKNTIYCESSNETNSLTLIDPSIDNYNISFKDENVNIIIAYSLKFIGSDKNTEIKIYDELNNLTDSFFLSNRQTTILKYKVIKKDDTKLINKYKLNINGNEYPIEITEKQTINIDTLLSNPQTQLFNTAQQIFLLPKKEFELDNIIELFAQIKTYKDISLKKNNYKTIAKPQEIKQLNNNLYYIKFVTYGLGDEGLNGAKWQDGSYIIEIETENETYFESIYINRTKEDAIYTNNNQNNTNGPLLFNPLEQNEDTSNNTNAQIHM